MATITSTIRLVDQMTPTLNKISKAIERINGQTNKIGNSRMWDTYNTGAAKATKSTNNLWYALRRAGYIMGALKSLKGLVNYADTMMNASARLTNVTGSLEKSKQLMDSIYASAQRSRGSYADAISSVAKLGTVAADAFGSTGEMVAFVELMNKLYTISGASAAEASNSMYQLTQAMAAGKLQGDEMRSILENAPMLATTIADSLGVTIGELKKLGAEGVITADVIKNALFGSAEEIEAKFNKMPKTIGQTWTEIKNYASRAFQPVVEKIQQFINSPVFEQFKQNLFKVITAIARGIIAIINLLQSPAMVKAFNFVKNAFETVGNVALNVAKWICDHWEALEPIIMGVAAAVLAYNAAMLVAKAIIVAYNLVMKVANVVTMLFTTKLGLAVLVIGLVIAVVYLCVNAYNKLTDSTVSAAGIIAGSLSWLAAVLWDIIWTVIAVVGTVGLAVGAVIGYVSVIIGSLILFISKCIAAVIIFFNQGCDELWNSITWLWDCIVVTVSNIGIFFGKIGLALWSFFASLCTNIGGVFRWLGEFVKTWGSNLISGFEQLGDRIGHTWEYVKATASFVFWSLVVLAGDALNGVLNGVKQCATKMIEPFAQAVNAIGGLFDKLANWWNSTLDTLLAAAREHEWIRTGLQNICKTIGVDYNTWVLSSDPYKLDSWSTASASSILQGWADNPIDTSHAETMASWADTFRNSHFDAMSESINWSTTESPATKDYFDFSELGDAWSDGWNELDYKPFPEYNVDWSSVTGAIKEMWKDTKLPDWLSFSSITNLFTKGFDWLWSSDRFVKPGDWYDAGYGAGEKFDKGIDNIIGSIGSFLGNFKTIKDLFTGDGGLLDSLDFTNPEVIPESLEDLLGSGNPTNTPESLEDLLDGAGYENADDLLGAILDNTKTTAGSTSNIEETLDLAEEELELLRKLAEQEVINRFTTAEIKVDMTNNNNINSDMDLDGIVTHLSTKLYEELGVVANGVHY